MLRENAAGSGKYLDQRAKEAAAEAPGQLGLDAIIERARNGWKAGVWIDTSRGPVVVECQNSCQHLREYLPRHMRYSAAGSDCYVRHSTGS